MEELQNYVLSLGALAVAIAAIHMIQRFRRTFYGKDTQTLALRFSLSGLTIIIALTAMHQIGRQTQAEFMRSGDSVLPALAVYALTLAGVFWMSSRFRQLQRERDQLKELAYRDSLTGLMNKNGMNHFWDRCKPGEQLAVLYMDLNGFKAINDSLGHHVGDLLLQSVGASLKKFTSKGKRHIFRIGGDEFVIIAKRCGRKEAEQLAVQILEQTTRNYRLERHDQFVSASIGITLSNGRAERNRLLKEADSAMYSAKQLGKGRYAIYKPGNAVQSVKWANHSKGS